MTDHIWIQGNCLEEIPKLDHKFSLVIMDPPYDEHELIDQVKEMVDRMKPIFIFGYAEDLPYFLLPEQVLFWIKQPSTKNTVRRYSRFVEIIAAYNVGTSPFNQDTHWTTRTGVFTDQLTYRAHEFAKPLSLMEKLVAVNSNSGDTILDPFAGSGVVENACRNLGRNSVSIEIAASPQQK